MRRNMRRRFASAAAAATLVLAGATTARAVCVGDCNTDGEVLINEIVASVNIFLETANVSTCRNADQNGDNLVLINEVVGAVNSFLDPEKCPMVAGGPTATPSATRTNTKPAATNTPSPTPTPTPTATQGVAVCGDGAMGSGEECDDGGICIGGTNAGTVCDSESDCQGDGVCTEGPKVGTGCANDAACPGAKCIHCKPFGGDGCAANCTNETAIPYQLVPGVADATTKACLGGTNVDAPCTTNAQCPGSQCLIQVKPGTTGAFVHDGFIQLALAIRGTQALTIGKLRDGKIPGIIRADSVHLERISIGALACACVRAVPAKTCGGVLFNANGTIATDCSAGFTAGDSICGGKNPCAFVHGPGNSSSGIIGCEGIEPINLTFTQDVGLSPLPYPPPPTPPPGSSLPVITLSGSGGPGSGIVLNSSAIGNVTGVCTGASVTNPAISGPDQMFCTDDDPLTSRGVPQTLPQVTGTAMGLLSNTNQSTQPAPNNKQIGPFSYTGKPYDCARLTGSTPTAEGANVVGVFTALNQPALGDIVTRNTFVIGPRQ